VTRITSPLLGRSHYTKYRMPPRVQHTHTPSYIYNIYPLMEHHPKKPQLCRNTSFIFQPSSFYLFCFACSFQTQVGQGDYCQMSVCLTSDKKQNKKQTIISTNNLSQRNLRRPAHLKKLGNIFLIWFHGVTHIFVLYNRIQQPDEYASRGFLGLSL
jgi:hypothetical protein